MKYECKKTENCFADAQTYEYRLPVTAEALADMLGEEWEQRRNRKLRRPVLIAARGSVRLKGVLAGNIVRVSFPDANWTEEKAAFEHWLEETDV